MAGVGGDEQLRLLGAWPSPFVHRVRVALHLKGLEYENVEEDLANKSELLLASNPVHKKIPVLLHGGRPVCESLVIVQYLDDAFPGAGQAILPADPYNRAVARFWAAYADDKFFAAWIKAFKGTTTEEKAAATAEAIAALETLEGAFKECSGGKGFFAGDAPGYVDVALGGFIGWMRAYRKMAGVDLLDASRTPLLAAWAERFAALEAARAAIPDVDRIAEFAKAMQARSAVAAAAAAAAPAPANN
ncbi:probable glutathione S-transferase GSTU6 [Phragmites australis]|uniref:probable glutathione S-transferase GSTU6 n=1 Tax=Phragmites australis TaxID=29695 RepID=UPI002D78624A|nr:probable glutathione S-transferase GSTU6 [Phragmites australis]